MPNQANEGTNNYEWDLAGWQSAKHVLCIRLDSLGDVVMTTPAIRAIKEARPGRSITLITSQAGAEVARLIPQIDHSISYNSPWMKATAPRENSQTEYQIVELLRNKKFDAAVIFTVFSQSPLPAAFMCYLADVPLRLAYCRENPYQLLTHWVRDLEPNQYVRHEVRRQLDLVSTVGYKPRSEKLSLTIPPDSYQRIEHCLEDSGLDRRRPWMVIHPGASASSRRYPPDSFAEASRLLIERNGFQVVFSGSKDEESLVSSIQKNIGYPTVQITQPLPLVDFSALIATAPLLLSNNTGPVHIAAAVGTPVVDLYAMTNPQHQPWQVPNRVLSVDVPCKYCYRSTCPEGHHNCLRLIHPESVVAAVLELWEESVAVPWAGNKFN